MYTRYLQTLTPLPSNFIYIHSAISVYQSKYKTLRKYVTALLAMYLLCGIHNAVLRKKYTLSDSFVKTLTHAL